MINHPQNPDPRNSDPRKSEPRNLAFQAPDSGKSEPRKPRPRKLHVHLDEPTYDALFSEALRRSQDQRRSVSLAEVARELIERWVDETPPPAADHERPVQEERMA